MGNQSNILWQGQADLSLENCLLTETDSGWEVHSGVIGMADRIPYRIDYHIRTNGSWETIYVELTSQLLDMRETVCYESRSKGIWTKDRSVQEELNGCIDIDISLTPFTNTLPINRLKLGVNQSQEITVLYFDILERKIKTVRQKYTRQSDTKYKFENVHNDFEAVITVDEQGFVVDYPHLFQSVYKGPAHYNLSARPPSL